jgi:murein DD-endopeptidase MepM/ murein hydrolase activator NlpD
VKRHANRRYPEHLVAMLAIVGALGTSACASGSSGGPAPAPGPAPALEPASIDSAYDADVQRDAALKDAEDLRVVAAEARAANSGRPRSILPFGVTWAPVPEEGSAFGIRVLERPSGRRPTALQGEFAGLPIRFGKLDGAWFGLAAVPIDTGPDQELVLRFEFDDGTTHEQKLPIVVESRSFASSQLSVAPKYSSPSAEALERIGRERTLIRSVLDTASAEWLIDTEFRAPRPMTITSPYGQARLFNGELRSRHTGLDLKGADGDPVRAAARGRVMIAQDLYFSGNGVYLDHGRGVYTGYFHLSRILVDVGEMVEAGQLIGEVGSTGRVTGPHLHWSLWVAGNSLDAGSLLEMTVPLEESTP